MTERDLKQRLKQFGLRAMRVAEALPRRSAGFVIGNQLVRSGTSCGANYRAACRAKSTADFVAKLAIVEEELDESRYWLELIVDSRLLSARRLGPLQQEVNELTAIIVASIRTARPGVRSRGRPSIQNPKSKIQNSHEGGVTC